jgi:hypothetical protein
VVVVQRPFVVHNYAQFPWGWMWTDLLGLVPLELFFPVTKADKQGGGGGLDDFSFGDDDVFE